MEERMKTWHLELDVVDDVEMFRRETGDLSEDVATIPSEILLNNIKKGLVAFVKEQWKGTRIENTKVTVLIDIDILKKE